jgi:hypothetical protein
MPRYTQRYHTGILYTIFYILNFLQKLKIEWK